MPREVVMQVVGITFLQLCLARSKVQEKEIEWQGTIQQPMESIQTTRPQRSRWTSSFGEAFQTTMFPSLCPTSGDPRTSQRKSAQKRPKEPQLAPVLGALLAEPWDCSPVLARWRFQASVLLSQPVRS